MEKYKNLGGNSGVTAYEITEDSIMVQFKNGKLYLFNHSKPGMAYVNKMKQLALKGSGLNSFISGVVKNNYYLKK